MYFIFLYVFCVLATESGISVKRIGRILMVLCMILAFCVAMRDKWPDEEVYIVAFQKAPGVFDFDWDVKPYGYVERGYLFLASICKALYNSPRFYLLAMAGLSMFLLYKSLIKYCFLPLFGLCDYVGRFLLNRDCQQMRSSLAILLIILGMKWVKERKMLHYMGLVALAYTFHHMALLAIPFYFLTMVRIRKRYILVGLVLAFILSQTAALLISDYVDAWSEDLQYSTYTEGNYVEKALGLANPMIYFQMGILFLLMLFEDTLREKSNYYYHFRTGYFYSTIILILFCNYTALSGRTSTMFATLEMFILPMIALAFPRGFFRGSYYLIVGMVLTYFFINKYSAVIQMMSGA
ncbi:MAG: EpsG family protein [Prevotella sp.]